MEPLVNHVQEMLTSSWAVGHDAGVICILQEVNLVARVGEKETKIWYGLQGVNDSVNLITVLKITTESVSPW